MTKRAVTIQVSEREKVSLETVVSRLQRAGLSNVSSSKRFGIVHGDIDSSREDALRKVEGVASVRPEQTFKAM